MPANNREVSPAAGSPADSKSSRAPIGGPRVSSSFQLSSGPLACLQDDRTSGRDSCYRSSGPNRKDTTKPIRHARWGRRSALSKLTPAPQQGHRTRDERPNSVLTSRAQLPDRSGLGSAPSASGARIRNVGPPCRLPRGKKRRRTLRESGNALETFQHSMRRVPRSFHDPCPFARVLREGIPLRCDARPLQLVRSGPAGSRR